MQTRPQPLNHLLCPLYLLLWLSLLRAAGVGVEGDEVQALASSLLAMSCSFAGPEFSPLWALLASLSALTAPSMSALAHAQAQLWVAREYRWNAYSVSRWLCATMPIRFRAKAKNSHYRLHGHPVRSKVCNLSSLLADYFNETLGCNRFMKSPTFRRMTSASSAS